MTEASTTTLSEEQKADGPKGIGGWLILPTIGTVVSPFAMAYWSFETGRALSTSLAPTLLTFIAIETVFNISLVVAWIVAIVMLFKHKRIYPKLFVALLAIGLVGTAVDLVVVAAAFDVRVDANDIKGLVRSVVGLAIWGPYMFISKRVLNTFVVD
jgi:hypothetical protein